MSNRIHHSTGHDVRRLAGLGKNSCAAVAGATALADDPSDVDEVAIRIPDVVRKLRSTGLLDESGSWWGTGRAIAETLGLDVVEVRREELDKDKVQSVHVDAHLRCGRRGGIGWVRPRYQYRRRDGYPTTAQWVRRHPDVVRALLHGTGHVGYLQRDSEGVVHIFNMGARKRIDAATVLEVAS